MRGFVHPSWLACSFLFVAVAAAEEKCGNCPVSGKPAVKSESADFKGKKVYYCCPNCPAAVAKNPDKFTAKINHQLLLTGQMVQVGCPFSGRPVNEETVVELAGAKFGFCCNNCKGKFEKADDKISLVFAKPEKGFTMQTKCPVSGKPINIEATTDYQGKKVYFCCENCPNAFNKNPEKFAAKLPKS